MTERPSPGCWLFRPRSPTDVHGDDLGPFRTRLAAALRAGHGVGASFRISATSGPDPSLWLEAGDFASVRWVSRVLTSSYERYQWRWSTALLGGGPASEVRFASRARPWPEPFRASTDGASAMDAVVLALGTLPTGAHCEWTFRPLPLTHRRWWEVGGPAAELLPRRVSPNIGHPSVPPSPSEQVLERPPFWEARVLIGCEARPFSSTLGSRVAHAIESATRSSRGNGLRFHRRRWWEGDGGPAFPMTEAEVALVLPGPLSPAPDGVVPSQRGAGFVLPLGRTITGRVVGPAIEPKQGRHLAILGETGMGKSSLLVALSRKVVPHAGLLVFDPLGETARLVRDELGPAAASRLTWVDPSAALGLNALEGANPGPNEGEARRERQLNDLVYSLRRVRSGRYTDSSYWGPRLEEMLTRALRAAAALPGGTLVDAHTLLATGARGFRTVPAEAVDAVRELSDRIRGRPEDADGARRLLYEVTRSAILVRMLCARTPAVRARDLVAPGRIVLIAGDAAEVGESTSRYLLSVYLALLWTELLARPEGTKTFVVLDEAQWFAHESLAEMLRLGRRRNVHVILATQAVSSLPEGVAEALWTNVADFVTFRGSPVEAREFSRVAHGVPPEAILALPRGEAAVLLGKGNTVRWLRTARVPGPQVRDESLSRVVHLAAGGPPAGAVKSPTTSLTPCLPEMETTAVEPREVLRAIAQRVRAREGEGVVRVSLAELRNEVDPTGRAVRAAGGMLGRSGAILRTGRDETGPCWWLDPRRIPVGEGVPVPEDDRSGSEPPQPS